MNNEYADFIILDGYKVNVKDTSLDDFIFLIENSDKMLKDFVRITKKEKNILHPIFLMSIIQLLIKDNKKDLLKKMDEELKKYLTEEELNFMELNKNFNKK